MGGLSGLLGLLPYAARPTADVVAAHNYANAAAQDKRRQQAIQDVVQKRAADQANLQQRIGESTIARNRTLSAGQWKPTPDGVHEFNSVTGDVRLPPGNATTPTPTPTSTPTIKSPVPLGFVPPGIVGPPTEDEQSAAIAPLPSAESAPPVAPDTAKPLNFGKPPVVKAPPRIDPNSQPAIDARTTAKISADSARAVNTQRAKVANPTPTRTPAAKDPRGDFIARQIPVLMKPTPKGDGSGRTVPSAFATADAAAAEAARRWDIAHGKTASAPTTPKAKAPGTLPAAPDPFGDIPIVKKPDDEESFVD